MPVLVVSMILQGDEWLLTGIGEDHTHREPPRTPKIKTRITFVELYKNKFGLKKGMQMGSEIIKKGE